MLQRKKKMISTQYLHQSQDLINFIYTMLFEIQYMFNMLVLQTQRKIWTNIIYHVKSFRMDSYRLNDGCVQSFNLKLISDRTTDGRIYNLE